MWAFEGLDSSRCVTDLRKITTLLQLRIRCSMLEDVEVNTGQDVLDACYCTDMNNNRAV